MDGEHLVQLIWNMYSECILSLADLTTDVTQKSASLTNSYSHSLHFGWNYNIPNMYNTYNTYNICNAYNHIYYLYYTYNIYYL